MKINSPSGPPPLPVSANYVSPREWFLPLSLQGCIFSKDFIYLFLDRGREKERERNIHVWLPHTRPLLGTWPATQACALTGNPTGNLSVPRPALNPLSHASQGYRLAFL